VTRVAIAVGEPDLAARLLERPRSSAIRHQLSALAAQAALAEAGEDHDSAIRLHAEAAEAWQAYGHPLERGLALFGLGRCRAQTGHKDAQAALLSAREVFTQLRAAPLVADTAKWLNESGATTA